MTADKKKKVIDAISILIIVVCSYSVVYHFATLGMDAHHDGFMFKIALDLAHGKVLYRDTFTQYGILPSYIQALFILIFGERVLSIRIATVIVYVITFVLNYLIWKRYVKRGLALALNAVALFMAPYYSMDNWFLPWPSVYSLMFTMLGVYCYILYAENKKALFLFACGLCSVCAFLCRQPVGLVLVIAFYLMQFIFLWIFPGNKKTIFKECWIYTLTLCAMILIFIIYLFISDSVGDYWIQDIKFMAKFGISMSAGSDVELSVMIWNFIVSLVNCLLGKIWTGEYVWGLLALICVAQFFLKVLRCKEKKEVNLEDRCVLMLNMYACASWHQYFPVPCVRHCYWGAFPMLGVVLYGLVTLCKTKYDGKNKRKNMVIYATAMLLFLVITGQVLWNRGTAIISKSEMNFEYVEDSGYDFLDGLKLSEEQWQFYYTMHKAIKSAVEETGKEVMNYSPHAYFAVFNNDNYYKQYINWGNTMYSDYEEIAQKYIEENEPVIIAASGMDIKDYHVYFTSSGDIGNLNEPREISIYVHD